MAASTITYNYPATQNNGQITSVSDTLSGETISYQYDALKRLTSASSSPISGSTPPAWTQTYQYDGFGNVTAKVLNGATTPIPVNAATNQLSSASYDLNGNMTSGSGATLTYDEANRVSTAAEVSGGIEYYGYSADNKRFYKYTSAGMEQVTFYGARGEKLGVYSLGYAGGPPPFTPLATNIWFAGKLILDSNLPTYQDRLGTNRSGGARFYPYGDEIASTANDREKFATYTRDSYTGFDYADQRYYASTYGRFNTADPYAGSGKAGKPASWNRYAYTLGDPVNANDPRGLDLSIDPSENEFADSGLYDYEGCTNPVMIEIAFQNGGDIGNCPQYYGAPIFTVAAPAPPTLTWSVSLYERPVYVAENLGGRIGTVNVLVGEHTYVDATAQLSTGAYVNLLCQWGPSLPNGSGNLIGSCASGYNTTVTVGPSGPGLPGNSQVGGTYSCGSCGVVVQLLASVDAYQQSGNFASYSPTANGGYNSNSYAFILLEDIGLAGYTPAGGIWSWFGTPWLAPGWGRTVPGLGP